MKLKSYLRRLFGNHQLSGHKNPGLVEASFPRLGLLCPAGFSGPKNPGLVEAMSRFVQSFGVARFPGLKTPASLKYAACGYPRI